MTKPWNGLPDQPEQSGWHIVINSDEAPCTFWWMGAASNEWTSYKIGGRGIVWRPNEMAAKYSYAGAVYSSSELAQMRKGERERAAKVAQSISDHYYALRDAAENDVDAVAFDERMVAANECAKAIRALPDEEGKKS